MNFTQKYIYKQVASQELSIQDAKRMLLELQQGDNIDSKENKKDNEDIAVIGMAGRFAGAQNLEEFWNYVKEGINCIRQVPEKRKKDIKHFISMSSAKDHLLDVRDIDGEYNWGGYLEEIDKFDAQFFNISPKEAMLMDPLQRLFLEVAWEAVENAGYGGNLISGTKTGVYVGRDHTFESPYKQILEPHPLTLTGSWTGILASRLSYILDLKGPSLVLDCACSSGLVAVHTACKALKNKECSLAIAGGVHIEYGLLQGNSQMDMIESTDHSVRAFDKNAGGTVWGEGIGVLLLKPLKQAICDGDNIHAVIKGSAVNNDGMSNGLTAPNPESQTSVTLKAWEEAGINPEEINYIEAHGTGTKLGDPIEIKSLNRAFKKYTNKKQFCGIGSVKTNIGHTVGAAGVASLIKVILALKHKLIPPMQKFSEPNPFIKFVKSPLYVSDELKEWIVSNHPRLAGINSFGFSGTNCHMVVQEAPALETNEEQSTTESLNIFTLSAKNYQVLVELINKYKTFFSLQMGICLEDICYTANTGRGHYTNRIAVLCKSTDELCEILNEIDTDNLQIPQLGRVYYGQTKVISSTEKKVLKNEITENTQKELSVDADRKLSEWRVKNDNTLLQDICMLYTKGAQVNWSELYKGQQRKRVVLPTYPYEKTRFWCESEPHMPTKFYRTIWLELQSLPGLREDEKQYYFLFSEGRQHSSEIVQKLLQENKRTIDVVFSHTYKKTGPNSYQTGCLQEDFQKLFADAGKISETIKIVYMLNVSDSTNMEDRDCFVKAMEIGVLGLFNLVKALKTINTNLNIKIILVGDYANEVTGFEEKINPHSASLFGLGKVIGQENPYIEVKCIDIDKETTPDDIYTEIVSKKTKFCIAYRNGKRYAENFESVSINDSKPSNLEIKKNGVYIITGGTGGIGLEISRYLAEKSKIKICLLNRSELIVPDDPVFVDEISARELEKVQKIKAIQKMGSQVYCISVDVSDTDELNNALVRIRTEIGNINGLIHCAGVHGMGRVDEKPQKDFTETLYPKYIGTWLLDQYTKQDKLDFFIMFSSVASVFGFPGQGDYVAANSFMDAFTNYRAKRGEKSLTVNWATWKETGMAVDLGGNIDGLFKTINTKEAIDRFDEVFLKEIKRIVIGDLNYDHIMLHSNYPFPLSFSNQLQIAIDKYHVSQNNTSGSYVPQIEHFEVTGKVNEEYSQMENTIAYIWASVLGLEEIDIYANFKELGGDSILAIKLYKEIEAAFPGVMSVTDIYTYPTVIQMAEYIGRKEVKSIPIKYTQKFERQDLNADIAIVGMACRFPGADDIEQFWKNLKNNKCSVCEFPQNRLNQIQGFFPDFDENAAQSAAYKAGYLDEIDKFDCSFFRISPREAKFMDPFQRLFLETAHEAIEHAGYGGNSLRNSRTGTYVGVDTINKPQYTAMLDEANLLALTGTETGMLASRISYMLDLKGPSIVVDTACSSGLVAVHMACMAIKAGECDTAIAGGINVIILPPKNGGIADIESNAGEIRAFDGNAKGTLWGEGVGAIILKPLLQAINDGDSIYAVIKGSAVNSDGASNGIAAPNPEAQTDVILQAWGRAGIDPRTVSYIEAHGTGTELGDPIEIRGLTEAFRRYTQEIQFCGIGSVKTNIGHTVGASGLASLIKVALSMRNGQIPASLNFSIPNMHMNIDESPLYVNDTLRKWIVKKGLKRAGISAFGLSGTNCHIVMEEAPRIKSNLITFEADSYILTISAKSKNQIKQIIDKYFKFFQIEDSPNIADICYTSSTGRGHYECRLAIIVESLVQLMGILGKLKNSPVEAYFAGDGVFYGECKIIPGIKAGINGEITKQQKSELTAIAVRTLEKFINKDGCKKEIMNSICGLYVNGADIPWERMYTGQLPKKVGLPAYVFNKDSYWPSSKQVRVSNKSELVDTRDSNEKKSNEKSCFVISGTQKEEISESIYELAGIWADVLELKEIDIFESFYNLGGDSIIAPKLLNQINQKFDGLINITDIFSYPTISELAQHIDRIKYNGDERDMSVKLENTDDVMQEIMSGLITGDLSIDKTLEELDRLLEEEQ